MARTRSKFVDDEAEEDTGDGDHSGTESDEDDTPSYDPARRDSASVPSPAAVTPAKRKPDAAPVVLKSLDGLVHAPVGDATTPVTSHPLKTTEDANIESFVVPAPPKTSGPKDPLELLLDEIRTYSLSIANLQSYESALAPASKKTPFLTMRGEKEVAFITVGRLVMPHYLRNAPPTQSIQAYSCSIAHPTFRGSNFKQDYEAFLRAVMNVGKTGSVSQAGDLDTIKFSKKYSEFKGGSRDEAFKDCFPGLHDARGCEDIFDSPTVNTADCLEDGTVLAVAFSVRYWVRDGKKGFTLVPNDIYVLGRDTAPGLVVHEPKRARSLR